MTDTVNAVETSRVVVEDNGTVAIELGGNSTVGKGKGYEVGAFVTYGKAFDKFTLNNPQIDFSELDAGVKKTTSNTVGFGSGAGLTGTFLKGGRENIDGKSTTETVCAVGVCGGGIKNADGEWVGGSLSGLGSSDGGTLHGGSFTHSESITKSYTIKDGVNKVGQVLSSTEDKIKSIFIPSD